MGYPISNSRRERGRRWGEARGVMEGGEGGMEGVREGVRWGDVCVRLLLARPVGRLTGTTTLPPNASLPLPSTPIPSLGRS